MVNFQINTDSYNPGNLGEVKLCKPSYGERGNEFCMIKSAMIEDDFHRIGYNKYGDNPSYFFGPGAAPGGGFKDRFWEYLNDCVVDLGRECYSKKNGKIYTYKEQLQQVDIDAIRQQVSDYFRDYYNKPRWRRALEDWWGDKSQANDIDKKCKLLGYHAAWQLLYDYYQIVQQEGKYNSYDVAKEQAIKSFFEKLDTGKGEIAPYANSLARVVDDRYRLLSKWLPGTGWSPFGSERSVSRFEAQTFLRTYQPATKPSLFQKMRTKLQNSYVAQKLGAIKNSHFVQNIGAKLKGWGSKMLGFFKKSNTSGRATTSTSEQQTPESAQNPPESEQNPQQVEQAQPLTPHYAIRLLKYEKLKNNRYRNQLERRGFTGLPRFSDLQEFDRVCAQLRTGYELQQDTFDDFLNLIKKIQSNNEELRVIELSSMEDNSDTRQNRADSTPNNPDGSSSNLDYADNDVSRRRPSLSGNPAALYGGGHNLAEDPDLINQNPERSQSPQPISH